MSEQQQVAKTEVITPEIVDPSTEPNEKLLKAFEKIAEKTMLAIIKRDYRATVVHREEQGQVPDAVNTFMSVDETEKDELGNPLELDIKGTITPFEGWLFKEVNYDIALANLKDWTYLPVGVNDDGEVEYQPVLLAQIDMLSKKRLNMAVNANQSNKHIDALRANSGVPHENSPLGRVLGWSGLMTERKSKEELEKAYGINQDEKRR